MHKVTDFSKKHTLLEKEDILNMIYPIGSVYVQATFNKGIKDLKSEGKFKCQLEDLIGGTWKPLDVTIANSNESAFVIDISSGKLANNSNLQIYGSNKSFAQRWMFGGWDFGTYDTGLNPVQWPDIASHGYGWLVFWVRTA